ncbi:DUF998 domain-containing protein [Paracoccus sp. MC1862]|uniref:DUF998 domain-containing protein n=1 Tax=Paracoccus sp. MC1862 TaxID=2760307 RepID=UPI0015FEFEB2|nr:DUF998 domain-containing protein [Paracoccus sp. MC1862]MBB1497855.1 DUF998 domain-containing protein [Paracoccus sp. MC1862]QQO44255.1 hypothetical protein JGR78_12865 [Paracoccus sp. MC1862]
MRDGDFHGYAERSDNDLVLSFLRVRRAIGLLGYFLPTVLVLWSVIFGQGLRPSISAYYYSPMREVLVGTLCAIAVFLWSYEGYRPRPGEWLSDLMAGRAASLGALAVALIPTAPAEPVACTLSQCVIGFSLAGTLHWLGAGAFFGALALFCLVLFVRGDHPDAEKTASNRIYRACGWIIVAALALIGLILLSPDPVKTQLLPLRPVFWLETIATFAFATSWMVKGDAMRPMVRAVAAGNPP